MGCRRRWCVWAWAWAGVSFCTPGWLLHPCSRPRRAGGWHPCSDDPSVPRPCWCWFGSLTCVRVFDVVCLAGSGLCLPCCLAACRCSFFVAAAARLVGKTFFVVFVLCHRVCCDCFVLCWEGLLPRWLIIQFSLHPGRVWRLKQRRVSCTSHSTASCVGARRTQALNAIVEKAFSVQYSTVQYIGRSCTRFKP